MRNCTITLGVHSIMTTRERTFIKEGLINVY